MRRIILPLLVAIFLPTPLIARVDPEVHNLCKDAKDYNGCVKANSFEDFNKKQSKTLGLMGLHGITNKKTAIEWCLKQIKNEVQRDKKVFCKNLASFLELPNSKCSPICFKDPITALNSLRKSSARTTKKEIIKSKATFMHKGKTYVASRVCPEGENMYWQYNWRKAWEIGCLTIKEKEKYARELGQRKRERESQQLKEALDDFGKAINPPTVYCDSFDNGYGFSTTCKQY